MARDKNSYWRIQQGSAKPAPSASDEGAKLAAGADALIVRMLPKDAKVLGLPGLICLVRYLLKGGPLDGTSVTTLDSTLVVKDSKGNPMGSYVLSDTEKGVLVYTEL